MTQRVKRFYRQVDVVHESDGYVVCLDGRSVKSPQRRRIELPTENLAHELAREWRQQEEYIEPAKMPVMHFVSGVTDGLLDDPRPARDEIVKYAGSDLLCYRGEFPPSLVERQAMVWDPVIERFATQKDTRFRVTNGICFVVQEEATITAVRDWVERLQGFELGAVHVVTTLTGSALLALALQAGWLTADEVWTASHVDEDHQAELWGRDEEAETRRANRFREIMAATLALSK